MFPITVTVHNREQLLRVLQTLDNDALPLLRDPRQMELDLRPVETKVAPGLAVVEPLTPETASKAALTAAIDTAAEPPVDKAEVQAVNDIVAARLRDGITQVAKKIGSDRVRSLVKEYAPALAQVPADKLPELHARVTALVEVPAADPKAVASALLSKVAARDKKAALALLQEHGVDRLDKAPDDKLPAIVRGLQGCLVSMGALA